MALSRPTLPSLHSLSLPTPAMNSSGSPIESLGLPRLPRLYRRNSVSSSATSSRTPSLSPPPVDTSTSSFSTHPGLRTPSPPPQPTAYPTPSSPDRGRRLSVPQTSTSTTFRLVPTTLAHADAILFVPPPTNPALTSLSSVPSISRLARNAASTSSSPPSISSAKDGSMSGIGGNASGSGQGRALLLVGPAMNHLRGGKGVRTQIARGARVHPYKIVRSSFSAPGASPTSAGGGARSKWRSSPTPLIPVRDVRAVGICD
ncbi:hypothetical protein BD410DRAFT_615052 [Rickenella mellea]|uniref:Uncharacterized protein n=1 Tax=Rickenella mellea TaxID=50990 RepID=A0A4Y7PNL4_9AGAM|nr:hypothetical protein BD410DRAFT_615052 [Rickenella mellea]